MTCGTCTHWRPNPATGMGTCAVRPEPWRNAISTSDWATCRIGKFVPIMPSMAAL